MARKPAVDSDQAAAMSPSRGEVGRKVVMEKRERMAPSSPTMTRRGDMVHVEHFYPTGHASDSALKVEKVAPAEVRVGVDYEYEIIVTNLLETPVAMVELTDALVLNFDMVQTIPEATRNAMGEMVWDLGTMEGGESKSVRVMGKAKAEGEVTHCARVTYQQLICLTSMAVEPALQLVKTAPNMVLICDPIPIRLVVTNTGTGMARNVVVEDNLPDGLVTENGETRVMLRAGDLDEGQSREFMMKAKATRTGTFENMAVAKADGDLTANARTSTVVKQPVLAITKTGTPKAFAGRNLEYTITVANRGDAAAENLMIQDMLPDGVTLVEASPTPQVRGKTLSWRLASLPANQEVKMMVKVKATTIGRQVNSVMAQADCATAVRAQMVSEVDGIPASLLEVIDLDDPIEVGKNETYEITVTNQGSAPGTNIRIVCTLPPELEYVSGTGVTSATSTGNTIVFRPLDRLNPKEKAVWRVVAKAVRVGSVRFKVSMTSDFLTVPVQETEATNLY
jgi:uncharacterized repeat protein (TIGR01451 family)